MLIVYNYLFVHLLVHRVRCLAKTQVIPFYTWTPDMNYSTACGYTGSVFMLTYYIIGMDAPVMIVLFLPFITESV